MSTTILILFNWTLEASQGVVSSTATAAAVVVITVVSIFGAAVKISFCKLSTGQKINHDHVLIAFTYLPTYLPTYLSTYLLTYLSNDSPHQMQSIWPDTICFINLIPRPANL